MGQNVAQKLIGSHLADGEMRAGSEIGLRIDQTLTQDATAPAARRMPGRAGRIRETGPGSPRQRRSLLPPQDGRQHQGAYAELSSADLLIPRIPHRTTPGDHAKPVIAARR